MSGAIVDYVSEDSTANLANGWWHLNTGENIIVLSAGTIAENGANSDAVYVYNSAISVSITCDGLIYGDGNAINSFGSGTRIQITGSVIGNEHAINMHGTGFINVGTSGTVMSNNVTIYLGDAWLTNAGYISSNLSHTIEVNGGQIVNSGTITSGEQFAIFWDADDSARIENSGTIIGDISGPAEVLNPDIGITFDNSGMFDGRLDVDGGRNTVDNTGHMSSSITFGDGDDIVLSHDGYIGGQISTGAGNDIVQAGAEDNTIEGGAGNDNLDGGGGVNTLSYTTSVRGVRVNLAAETATHGDAGGDVFKNFSNVVGSLKNDILKGDDGDNTLIGYLGRDKVFGGDGNDFMVQIGTGNATLNGGDGDDLLGFQTLSAATYGEAFTAKTTANGGNGFDTLELANIAPVVFTATTVTNVERFLLLDLSSYSLTLDNATVANSGSLDVDASGLSAGHTISFNGSAETGGSFTFEGGAAGDTFTGGGGTDTIEGGVGADKLAGGAGADTFSYYDVTDSTFAQHDKVADFVAGTDKFQMDVEVTGVDTAVTGATVSNGTQLHNAVAGHLNANHAILVQVTGGSEAGHILMVVDGNGVAGYQTGADYVIDVTGSSGVLAPTDFIVA